MAKQFYSIKIEGLDELKAAADKAGSEYVHLMEQAMGRAVTKVQNDIKENITNKGISNTGNLRRSVQKHEVTATRGVVGVDEKYGAYVEFGTSPHFPPVAPLERWAQTKLGTPGLGFIIARKIARSGTPAQPYAVPAFVSNVDFIFKQFVEAGEIIVKTMGR